MSMLWSLGIRMTSIHTKLKELREEWRPVLGREGYYEASSFGRIRSLRFKNKVCDKLRDEPLIIKQARQGSYLSIWLCRGPGGRKLVGVHVLVLESFSGPRPPGLQAAHQDGNPHNNRADNLKWMTPLENMRQRNVHGTNPRGEQSATSKLTEKEVLEIRRDFKPRCPVVLAKKYGVHRRTILAIVSRKTWTHI